MVPVGLFEIIYVLFLPFHEGLHPGWREDGGHEHSLQLQLLLPQTHTMHEVYILAE
jgi:hypothetical protein